MDNTEEQITALFRGMDRVRKAWKSVTPCPQLSKSQFGTLMSILHHSTGEDHTITLSDLAATMHQSAPALSQRIKDLENLGYVKRIADSKDRRKTGISLTDEGKEVLLIARSHFRHVMSLALEHMGNETSETLIDSLCLLAEAFEFAVAQEKEARD